MENSVISPIAGETPALTPEQAYTFHEFFKVGFHREVLLLGDPAEQWVHHVERRKRKICTSSAGRCALCEAAPFDRDIEPRQLEYVAPAYVRPLKESEFVQRVAVFPRAAGEELGRQCGDDYRGRLLTVVREPSNRLKIKVGGELPKGIAGALPPAFSMLPFIRARFGLKQDPREPAVFLPPFRCEQVRATVARPKPLALTKEDIGLTVEAKTKLSDYAAKLQADTPEPVHVPPAPAPSSKTAATQVLGVVVRPADPVPVPVPAPARPSVPEVLDAAAPTDGPVQLDPMRLLLSRGEAVYGPKKLTRAPLDAAAEEEALSAGTGSILCGDFKSRATVPFSKNGHGKNGGAK